MELPGPYDDIDCIFCVPVCETEMSWIELDIERVLCAILVTLDLGDEEVQIKDGLRGHCEEGSFLLILVYDSDSTWWEQMGRTSNG
jgi:hypothetical protein